LYGKNVPIGVIRHWFCNRKSFNKAACELTVGVVCLFGGVSYNLDTNIESSILAQTQSSAVAIQESGWSLSMNTAQAIETISVVGQRPPSGGSCWGGGDWDQTDFYNDYKDDYYDSGSGGGNTDTQADKKTPTKKCQKINSSILAPCVLSSATAHVINLRSMCFGQGTLGISGGVPFFEADFKIDAYGFCNDYSKAQRDESIAKCHSNNAELTKLCPAG
jgi:hypothetical protein